MHLHLNYETLSIADYRDRPIPERAYRYQLRGKSVLQSMEKAAKTQADPDFCPKMIHCCDQTIALIEEFKAIEIF